MFFTPGMSFCAEAVCLVCEVGSSISCLWGLPFALKDPKRPACTGRTPSRKPSCLIPTHGEVRALVGRFSKASGKAVLEEK